MAVSDKLQTVADNVQKVYKAGKAEGYSEGFTSGKVEGEADAKHKFEELFTNKGLRKVWANAFSQQNWTGYEFTYDPYVENAWAMKQGLGNIETVYKMFHWYTGTELPKGLAKSVFHSTTAAGSFEFMSNLSGRSQCEHMFSYATKLREIDVTGLPPCGNLDYFAYNDIALERIEGISVFTTATLNNAFTKCANLKEISFRYISGTGIGQSVDFGDCISLSKNSVKNIIYYLHVMTSNKTVTFSKACIDKAFETSEGANDGSESTEWERLIAGPSTVWTIALI